MLNDVLSNHVSIINAKIRKALLGYLFNGTVCLPGNFSVLSVQPQVDDSTIKVKFNKHRSSEEYRTISLRRIDLKLFLKTVMHPCVAFLDGSVVMFTDINTYPNLKDNIKDVLDSILGTDEYKYEFLNNNTITVVPTKLNLMFHGSAVINLRYKAYSSVTLIPRPSFLNLISTHNHNLQKLLIEPALTLKKGDTKQINQSRISLDNATLLWATENKALFRVDKNSQYSTLCRDCLITPNAFERTVLAKSFSGVELTGAFGKDGIIYIPKDYELTIESILQFFKEVYGLKIDQEDIGSFKPLLGGQYKLSFDKHSKWFFGDIVVASSNNFKTSNPLNYDLSTFIM